jgi:hypothetical protein
VPSKIVKLLKVSTTLALNPDAGSDSGDGTGGDVPRYRELQRWIAGRLGTEAEQRLAVQAVLVPLA